MYTYEVECAKHVHLRHGDSLMFLKVSSSKIGLSKRAEASSSLRGRNLCRPGCRCDRSSLLEKFKNKMVNRSGDD